MQINKRCKQLIKEGLDNKTIRKMLFLEYDQEYDVAACRYRMKNKANRPTLVWSDVHIPFNHPRYLEFLQDTYKQYKCDKSICLGDLIDNHAISRHQSEPDSYGALQEYELALEEVAKYAEAFPNTKLVEGNHCSIPRRQAATLGIPSVFLKDFKSVWQLPDTWEVKNAYVIDDVVYKHEGNSGGKDGAINSAIIERMSTCIGHYHAFAGIKYIANHRNIVFGMNVGCGIDVEAYAFAYGRLAKYRPILGCGVVFSSTNAIFVPMDLEKYGRDK